MQLPLVFMGGSPSLGTFSDGAGKRYMRQLPELVADLIQLACTIAQPIGSPCSTCIVMRGDWAALDQDFRSSWSYAGGSDQSAAQ